MVDRKKMWLSSCAVNDVLYINRTNKHNGSRYIGTIILEKIKSIPGGGIQIKYRNKYHLGRGVIQKTTFKQDLMVENEGPFVPPLVKPVTIVDVDAIKRSATTPKEQILERVRQSREMKNLDLSPNMSAVSPYFGGVVDGMLRDCISLSGGQLRSIKDDE